jgi:hypothetical protein
MKKAIAAAAALLLVLTGCSPATLQVAESIKNSMDLKSFESKTAISVSGHIPDLPMDDQIQPVVEVLKKGIVIDTVQKNDQESHVTLSLNNPAPILGSKLWPYQTAPSFDTYTNGNVTYIKSSVDKKYLALASEAANSQNAGLSENMGQFIKAFVSQYDYDPKHLEKVGQEKVTLSDGSFSDTTHFRITLDMQEALEMAAYTLENLSKYEGLKDLPSLLPAQVEDQQGTDVGEIRSQLSEMAKQIKALNVQDLKASGFDGNLGLDLWIDNDNQIVQNEADIDVKLPNDPEQPSANADHPDFHVTIWNQSWNLNKNVTISYPTNDAIVTAESVKNNAKLLKTFDKSSPNRFLAKSEVLSQAESFDDVPPYDWAYEPVTMLRQMNMVSGYDNNEFKPDRLITRAEFIKMAVSSLGLQQGASELSFKDKGEIPAWAEQSVKTAVAAGLIDGYEDGTVRPNQPISRAEIVAILVKGYKLPIASDYSLTYTDRNAIPVWAAAYVRTAAAKGLVDGYEDGSFAPNKQAKRSEVASILYKAVMM